MVRVIFATGVEVSYPNGTHWRQEENGLIEVLQNGAAIAYVQASAGAVVCGLSGSVIVVRPTLADAVKRALEPASHVSYSDAQQLKRLKKELKRFDGRKGRWNG